MTKKQFAVGVRVAFDNHQGTQEGVVVDRTSKRIIVQGDDLFRHRFVRRGSEWLRATPYSFEQDNLREVVPLEFLCETCEEAGTENPWHPGEEAHKDQFNGEQLYAVTCSDGLTEWVNLWWPNRPAKKR